MAKHLSRLITSRAELESAFRHIAQYPYGYMLEARDPTRSDEQNRLLWPLLGCFEHQSEVRGQRWKDHQWKSMFMEALGHEQEILPSLDGSRWFAAGLRTSKLGIREFSDLIERINAEAAERNVDLTKAHTKEKSDHA